MFNKLSRRQLLKFGSGAIVSSVLIANTSNQAKGQGALACFWTNEQAFIELQFIYWLLLGRDLDSDGRAHYTSLLQLRNDPWRLKEVVADIGGSPEYGRRFVQPYLRTDDPGMAVRQMYQKFLGRPPENENVVREKLNGIYRNGHARIVAEMVLGEEYRSRWGDNGTPNRSFASGYGCIPGFAFCRPTGPYQSQQFTVYVRRRDVAERIATRVLGTTRMC